MNLLTGKEEERGRMIGQYPKAEVAPFSSAEIEIRKSVFWNGGHDEQISESHAKTLGEETK